MAEPIIQFDHVSFQYDSQAEPTLHDVSLTIARGEKVLIVGPSGSGKSTLGNLINGLIPHAIPGKLTGKVTVCGQDVAASSVFDLSQHVGTVLQDPDSQFVGLTTAEDIAFALENDGAPVPEMHERVAAVAKTLGISGQLTQSPQDLSGGQKQRTAMAGVLIDNGQVLLFDEPLAALDPATGKSSIKLIEDLHARLDVTVVIIEHRLEDVLTQPVDRVLVIDNGQLIADVTPSDLLHSALLPQIGVRSPLYLQALTAAGVDLATVTGIASVQTVAAPHLESRLRAWSAAEPAAPRRQVGEPLLTIQGLRFGYDRHTQIFKDLDLTINRGDMVALVGRNGVGKTTLSQLLVGFEQPQAGTMRFAGTDLKTLSIKERADRIGYIMQDPNQMISKNLIRDEVGLGLDLRGVPAAERDARVDEALRICGLYEFRHWPISALSFGQKKRVTIAAILVLQPAMMILDEPTAGQDWRHYTQMMRFLESLNQEHGMTIMLITHDMHLMLEYASRTIVLGDDGILMDAAPARVLSDTGVIEAASLAETSLYQLAQRFGLDPDRFTGQVIEHERQGMSHDE
ncbi:ABC transporter ATP-binding protein [Lacticaseibacillus kribbianus]|uniref:ABC transporter ATP-binding protein n=1 Tax=Lacticaseibacillus kribbianus TaxID=2926292 RepID=UPI001CD5334C|nr:ABC transporter ATP-binding protein [Lacticaseibacillus kribbianus]